MYDISPGKILIADPFLRDPNFIRSVVFLCEHKENGSVGFVLNKIYDQPLKELIEQVENTTFSVYYGGPVQRDTLHFLHQRPEIIPGGVEVIDGMFWGGDFEVVVEMVKADKLSHRDIRFFIGYSGWSEGQLEEEMTQKSWITSDANRRIIFPADVDNTWKYALTQLGGEYAQMVNYPIDPQLN